MKKIAVFASGSGSNFQAIVNATRDGRLQAEVGLLVCDKPGAKVIERAATSGIEIFVFSPKEFESKSQFEQLITEQLAEKGIELIVLAGYMRLVGETLLIAYKNKIVNIHPSLLPLFPGKDAIGQAFQTGVSKTGITIHYVDEGMDTGPIIAQQAIEIEANETRESLEEKIHLIEHQFYPQVLQTLINEKVKQ